MTPGRLQNGTRLRRLTMLFGLMLMASFARAQSQTVFVNELVYDSHQLVGNTFQEVVPNLIEIAGPANTNVDSYSLVFYERVTNNSVNVNQGEYMALRLYRALYRTKKMVTALLRLPFRQQRSPTMRAG